MHCHRARRLLSDYLDRRLNSEVRQALKHHLAACSDCRAELEGLRRATDLLHGVAAPQPPPDFAEKVKRSVAAAAQRPAPVRPARQVGQIAAAIACGLLVVGSVHWYMHKPLSDLPPLWPEVREVRVPVEEPPAEEPSSAPVSPNYAEALAARTVIGAKVPRPSLHRATRRTSRVRRVTPPEIAPPVLAMSSRTRIVAARVVEETATIEARLEAHLQPVCMAATPALVALEDDARLDGAADFGLPMSDLDPAPRESAPIAMAAVPTALALETLTTDYQVPGL